MIVPVESQLYELERVEESIASILAPAGVQIQSRFSSTTTVTPRIELVLRVQNPTGVQHILFPGVNAKAPAQPLNSWKYELDTTIITDRSVNGAQHIPLIGKVRWMLQYYRLAQTFTRAVSPYHVITSCQEIGQADEVVDGVNIQKSKITWLGVLNIREDVWPAQ